MSMSMEEQSLTSLAGGLNSNAYTTLEGQATNRQSRKTIASTN